MAPTPPFLADRFALIIDGLCRSVAARMCRLPPQRPMFMLLWATLRRRIARFAALAERVSLGTLPTRPATPRPPRPGGPPRPRLPSGFAWLLASVPEAAAYGSQLRHLLAEPEMAALLAAAPQLPRMLRPLCWMLGTSLPSDPSPPPRPASASPSRQAPPQHPDPAGERPGPSAPRRPPRSPRLGLFLLHGRA